jgi:hypothetical protein
VESKLGPLCTSAIYWPVVPAPGDCEDGEFGGMKIGRGNRSIRRKPAPAPLSLPQIPLDQTRARTRVAAVGSQRQTAWAMARPGLKVTSLARNSFSYLHHVLTLSHVVQEEVLTSTHQSQGYWNYKLRIFWQKIFVVIVEIKTVCSTIAD